MIFRLFPYLSSFDWSFNPIFSNFLIRSKYAVNKNSLNTATFAKLANFKTYQRTAVCSEMLWPRSSGFKSISVEFALKGYHPYLNVPGTLKRVIFKRCDRILHERRVDQVRRQQNTRTSLETIYPLVNHLVFRYSLNNNVQKHFLIYHLRGSFPRNNFSMHCFAY
jgi:hypothetical protein